MAQITCATDGGRKYKLSDGKRTTTTRLTLEVAGMEKKNVKLILLSNSKITECKLFG